MIKCTPKPVKRGAIQFGPHSLAEIIDTIGPDNMDDHMGQSLVNTKRHGWQNVDYGDYLVFDEDNRLLKVLKANDFKNNYSVND
jgi:hypothetical protein|nr:MAG TPA: PGDYG protein [Caudoviricetes sp.]